MKMQTLFEPVTLWQFGGFTVVRTKDQQKLMKRLYNAEVGFDYTNRVIIPGLSNSREQHRDNAKKLREENKALAHDLERHMEIANIECNRAENLSELLDDVFDFLGGCDGASELRQRILAASGTEAGTAETENTGSVHEGPVPNGETPNA